MAALLSLTVNNYYAVAVICRFVIQPRVSVTLAHLIFMDMFRDMISTVLYPFWNEERNCPALGASSSC